MDEECIIYDSKRKRRVKIFGSSNGSYSFIEEKFSEEPLEMCWVPQTNRRSLPICSSFEIALREARSRIEWLEAVTNEGYPLMESLPQNVDDCILMALSEAVVRLDDAFRIVNDMPPAGSALDQCGLRDGDKIVHGYLGAGEPGLALEHVIYMVSEPALPISLHAYQCIEKAGQAMSMDRQLWEGLKPMRTPG